MKSKPLKKLGDQAPKGFTPGLYSNLQEEEEDDFSSTGTMDEEMEEEEPILRVVVPKRKMTPIVYILKEESDFR